MSPDLVTIPGVFSVAFGLSPQFLPGAPVKTCHVNRNAHPIFRQSPELFQFYSCCQRCVGSPVPNNLFCGLAFHLSLPNWLTSRLTAGEYWLFVLEYFVKPCLLSVDLGMINLWLSPNHLKLPRLNLFVFLKVWASSPPKPCKSLVKKKRWINQLSLCRHDSFLLLLIPVSYKHRGRGLCVACSIGQAALAAFSCRAGRQRTLIHCRSHLCG